MHYVGVDWADETHQIAIITSDGTCISEFEIAEDSTGLQRLQEHLELLSPVHINIERPDGLLVDWFIQQGFPIFVTPPRIAAHRRPRRSKDDRGDARLLAQIMRAGDEDCRLLQRHSSQVETLLQLLRAFEQIQRQQIRNANQLRQILKQYYPAMLRLFSDIRTNIALAFLQTYPEPQTTLQLCRDELDQFLRTQRYSHMQRLDAILHILHTPAPTATVWRGNVTHAQTLAAILQTLNLQLCRIKRDIQQSFLTHPEAEWWQAFPGAGALTAPRLLALIGDNRAVFPTAEVLQAHAGTVPVTRRSGKSKSVRFRWACDKALRKTMTDLARHSIPQSGWAASYYHDQLQRGHAEQRALRALANRWVRIIWTLWQRREPYDESIHLANRSRRGTAATS
jgi:transposase